LVVERRAKAFEREADGSGMALEQIEGEMAEDSEVFGSVVEADATGIFAKGDIERPMEGVFNGPMSRCRREDGLGIGRQTGQEIRDFSGSVGLVGGTPFALYEGDSRQTRPAIVMRQGLAGVGVSNHPAAPDFEATVGFVDSFIVGMLNGAKRTLLRPLEPVGHVLMELGMVGGEARTHNPPHRR